MDDDAEACGIAAQTPQGISSASILVAPMVPDADRQSRFPVSRGLTAPFDADGTGSLLPVRAAALPPGFFPSLTSTPLRGAPAMAAVTGRTWSEMQMAAIAPNARISRPRGMFVHIQVTPLTPTPDPTITYIRRREDGFASI
jgi:hypothetical protein